jgi:hypothetical protein
VDRTFISIFLVGIYKAKVQFFFFFKDIGHWSVYDFRRTYPPI